MSLSTEAMPETKLHFCHFYRIKLGKRADEQGKGKNIGIKHRTPYYRGSPY